MTATVGLPKPKVCTSPALRSSTVTRLCKDTDQRPWAPNVGLLGGVGQRGGCGRKLPSVLPSGVTSVCSGPGTRATSPREARYRLGARAVTEAGHRLPEGVCRRLRHSEPPHRSDVGTPESRQRHRPPPSLLSARPPAKPAAHKLKHRE